MNSLKCGLLAVLSLLVLQACKEKEKETETLSQMKEVMAIHDEVMPKMGTIGKLVAELKPKVDSTETGIAYDKAMKDLQEAHKAMMDWMKGFGDRFTSDEILNGAALTAQKQEWLNEEEKKVKALKLQINTSIENAEKLLE
jgi:predicted  nucleic acid-binding Zn-ribbon protein